MEYVLSKKLHADNDTVHSQKLLSMKFQIAETIRVTDTFLPIVVIKCGLTVFGAVAIYIVVMVRDVGLGVA